MRIQNRSISSDSKENGPVRMAGVSSLVWSHICIESLSRCRIRSCSSYVYRRVYACLCRPMCTCDYFMSSLEKLDTKSQTDKPSLIRWLLISGVIGATKKLKWLRRKILLRFQYLEFAEYRSNIWAIFLKLIEINNFLQ